MGRHARLELTFDVRRGRTALSHAYAEPPFRAGRTFLDGDRAHLILASSAPGIFGGDVLEQTVTVRAGARVRLTSQSALQVHPAADLSPATLVSRYRVEGSGVLHCTWDPVIPFPDARFDQRTEIDLHEDATLFWSDAMMSGREARGERWRFSRLNHELRCTRGGSLTYLERYALDPRTDALGQAWIAAGACYFGTILVVGPEANHEETERLHAVLNAEGLRGAVDVLESNVIIGRVAAESGTAFRDARNRVIDTLGH